ncbi:hypothetical protein BpHYR1_011158 [Brachionus plicatilis]|uniref:Cep192-like domain-containing protein n=1 Tax=Brachionus plicatilis TaxID=10195 RepID=A0A3M7S8E8_BRAPC|nr:hypothetical protein BpHYR1_011158 [Brachionus plicatilis]
MKALSKSNLPSPTVANEYDNEENADPSDFTAKKKCYGTPKNKNPTNTSLSNDLTFKMSTSFNLTGIDDTFACLEQMSVPQEDNHKTNNDSSLNFSSYLSDSLDQLNQKSVERAKRIGQALNNYNEDYLNLFEKSTKEIRFSTSTVGPDPKDFSFNFSQDFALTLSETFNQTLMPLQKPKIIEEVYFNKSLNPFDSLLGNFGLKKNLEPSFSQFKSADDFLHQLNQDEQLNRKEFADNELTLINQTSANSSNNSILSKWWNNAYQAQPNYLEVTNLFNEWSKEQVNVDDFFMHKSEMPSYLANKKSDVHLSDVSRMDENNNFEQKDQQEYTAAQIRYEESGKLQNRLARRHQINEPLIFCSMSQANKRKITSMKRSMMMTNLEKLKNNQMKKFLLKNNLLRKHLGFDVKYRSNHLNMLPNNGIIEQRKMQELIVKPMAEIFAQFPLSDNISISFNRTNKDVKVRIYSNDDEDTSPRLINSSSAFSNSIESDPLVSDLFQYSIDSFSLTPLICASFINAPSCTFLEREGNDAHVRFPAVWATQRKSIQVTLTNLTKSHVNWKACSTFAAFGHLKEQKNSIFMISPNSGAIPPNQNQKIRIEFSPRRYGLFSQYWQIDTSTDIHNLVQSSNQDTPLFYTCKLKLTGTSIPMENKLEQNFFQQVGNIFN